MLHNRPNIVQLVKCCVIDKLISCTVRLVKRAIDQLRATLTLPRT